MRTVSTLVAVVSLLSAVAVCQHDPPMDPTRWREMQ
jgi:hypothetical protein